MPKTIDSLLSPKQPAQQPKTTSQQRQQNASFPFRHPPLHLGNQACHAIPASPLQSSLRLHRPREHPRLTLLKSSLLLRLRRQVPGRGRVRALHVQHEQARALPGRLLSLLLLLRPEAVQRSVGVCIEVLHIPGHLPPKTSQGSGLPGSSTTGDPEPVMLLENTPGLLDTWVPFY